METPVADPETDRALQDDYRAALLADPQTAQAARENTAREIANWRQQWLMLDVERRAKEASVNALRVGGRLRMTRWGVNSDDRDNLQKAAIQQTKSALANLDYRMEMIEASVAAAEEFLASLPEAPADDEG